MRPLLLLDVDGPLHPFAATRPEGYVEHRYRLSRWSRRGRVWLNPRHGPQLVELAERTGAELAWATSWGHRANAVVGPAIGLPPLPVVEFAGPHADTLPTWKYPAVARFAYDRPLAWLDDDFELHPKARDAFLAKRQAPTLLAHVDPGSGITPADLHSIEAWLSAC